MIKEIAKSIYDAIQVKIESGYCPRFLNFCFNEDGEFVKYFFTDDVFDSSSDELKWGGIEREEYVNMSIEDIEEELEYTLNN